MLSRTRELEHLAIAQRHVIRCRQLIHQQIAIIRSERTHFWDDNVSLTLLRELRRSQTYARDHLHAIEAELNGPARRPNGSIGARVRALS